MHKLRVRLTGKLNVGAQGRAVAKNGLETVKRNDRNGYALMPPARRLVTD
jgi:hypothetical protein